MDNISIIAEEIMIEIYERYVPHGSPFVEGNDSLVSCYNEDAQAIFNIVYDILDSHKNAKI